MALLLVLGGCVDGCRVCLKGGQDEVVAPTEIAKITTMDGTKLPSAVRDVRFHEECGKDCIQWLRFTAPETDVRGFAERFLKSPLRKGYDPMPDYGGTAPGLDHGWWPSKFPEGHEGGKAEGRPGMIVVVPSGGSATVWMSEFDT